MIGPAEAALWLAGAALEAAGLRLLVVVGAPLPALAAHLAASAFVALGALRHVRGPRGRAPALVAGALALAAPPLGIAAGVAVALAGARRLPRLPAGVAGWDDDGDAARDGGEGDDADEDGAGTDGGRGGRGGRGAGGPRGARDAPGGWARLARPVFTRPVGDRATTLLDAACFGDARERRAAIARLADLPGPESWALLETARRDGDPAVRALAARALAAVDHGLDREVVVALEEVQKAPDSAEAHALLASRQAELIRATRAPAAARVHVLEMAVKSYVRALFGIGDRFRQVLVQLGRTLLDLARIPAVEPARAWGGRPGRRGRTCRPDRLALARRLLERAAAGPAPDPRSLAWRLEVRELVGDLGGVRADAERARALEPADPRLAAMVAYWAGGLAPPRRADGAGGARAASTSSQRIALAAAERAALAAASPAAARLDLGREVALVLDGLAALEAPRRAEAERRMRALTDDEAIETLGRAMLAANDGARLAFARHLAATGGEVAARWLGALLASERRWLEEAAIEGLERLAPEDKVEALYEALDARSAIARAYAAEALAAIGARGAAQAVAWRLDDDRVPVVRALLRALVRFGDRAHAAAIAPLTRDGREEVRFRALGALGALDPERAGPRAARLLAEDPSARVRHTAAWALGQSGWRGAEAALARAAFEERDPAVLGEVLRRLAALAGPRAVPALCLAASGVRGRDARRAAELAVASLDPAPARAALVLALGEREPEVRRAAAALLGALGGDEAVEPIVAALARETEAEARVAFVEALGALGSPVALDALRGSLDADDAPLGYAAALALAELRGFDGLVLLGRRLGRGAPFGELVEAALLRGLARAAGEPAPRGRAAPEAPPELIDRAILGLASSRPGVRDAAATAIGAWRAARAVEPLLEALTREESALVRGRMAESIARALDHRPGLVLKRLGAVCDALFERDAYAGHAGAGAAARAEGTAGAEGAARTESGASAASAAGPAGDPSAPPAGPALGDGARPARAQLAREAAATIAALAAMRLGPEAYEESLRRALAAALVLRRAGAFEPAAAPLVELGAREPGALLAFIGDRPGYALEVEALELCRALARAEPRVALDPGPLREALGREDPGVRAAAARALEALGDGDSLPLLVQLVLEDADDGVRDAARGAVRAYASVERLGPPEGGRRGARRRASGRARRPG